MTYQSSLIKRARRSKAEMDSIRQAIFAVVDEFKPMTVRQVFYQLVSRAMNLPTRPTKKTDSRAKNFKGESVEVDAIHPDRLRQMCEACILHHVDDRLLQANQAIEDAERETLSHVLLSLEGDE